MAVRIATALAAMIGLVWLLRNSNVYTDTLGLRLNNPGNIRAGGSKWKGKIGQEKGFVKFASPEWGIRAMGRLLTTYNNRYGANTIREIITRWAPPEDNNPTEVYVDNVARWVGQEPDYPLWVGRTSKEEMQLRLVKAIIRQEQGLQPYSDEFIQGALQLA